MGAQNGKYPGQWVDDWFHPGNCFVSGDEMMELTPRQREIAVLVTYGLTNKAIARHLDLAEGTVKVQLHLIYKRLQLQNRTQLGCFCIDMAYKRAV
jgi:DNA-binding NarL/FixJ family response regulator